MRSVMTASPSSTVGRGNRITPQLKIVKSGLDKDTIGLSTIYCGDSLKYYSEWESPSTIISDGGYGILGFQGDTADPSQLVDWYEPHIAKWSESVRGSSSLWFWNSEVGWASVHNKLVEYGWEYRCCNTWNKTKSHIAGNVNTSKLRAMPVVTEVCVLYFKSQKINGVSIKDWFISEWSRTGLPRKRANDACGVKDAATRKYLDRGHLWYFPPSERFQMMSDYANLHGNPQGKPYFSVDGVRPLTGEQWDRYRPYFDCPYGITNVWERLPLKGAERLKVPDSGMSAHLNQKPIDLTEMLIKSSTREGDVVWEPFGGLFTSSLVSNRLRRRSFASEIDPSIFEFARSRLLQDAEFNQQSLPV